MRGLASLYATVDVRALAAGRIALALVLQLDLIKRLPGLSTWYTNEGLLPNHTLLWKPTFDPTFSPFYMASHGWQAGLGFAVCGLAYLALLLGWRTKAAQVASLVAVLGLHGRVLFLQNGGDVALSLLALWTVFLPTGERYSIDAWLRSERLRGEESPLPIAGPQKVVSLGFTALLLQLVVIYAFNCVHKTGPNWRDGSAVHYTLHQDRMVTSFGVWFREWMPMAVGQWLTWSALAIEALLPLLLLSPFGQRWSRRGAAVLIVALHAGFALFMNLGVFSAAMIAFAPNLLPTEDWDRFDLWWRGRQPLLASSLRARVSRWVVAADSRLPVAPAVMPSEFGTHVREALVAILMLVAASQVLVENAAIPRRLRLHQPAFMAGMVSYLQLFQGWTMFAPDAPREDLTVIVDAVTKDERHVDPLSEAASPAHAQGKRTVSPGLGHDSFFCDYLARISGQGWYHQALIEWVARYPERTGRQEDAIVSFDLIEVSDKSPPPGETDPRDVHAKNLLSHKF